MSPALTVEIEEADVAVVRPAGFMDASTARLVEEEVTRLVRQGANRLLFDGAELSYLSSDGLGGILQHVWELRRRGGDLKLARLHGKAETIVRLLGLDQVLDVFDTLEEALDAFARPLPGTLARPQLFLATPGGRTFHLPSCRYVLGRKPADLTRYEDRTAALTAGRRPCRVCQP